MKKQLLLLFLCFSVYTIAQDKITFDYDTAGNQIKRELCINCSTSSYKSTSTEEVEEEDDLPKSDAENVLSYYPNPVKEELHIQWELVEGKSVSTIYLYDLNGRVLQAHTNLDTATNLNLPFLNYPSGLFLVVIQYNGGEQKTIKIVKR
jgi:hypothetical protein